MKTSTLFLAIATWIPDLCAAESQDAAKTKKFDTAAMLFFNRPYSNTLGYSLYNTSGYDLYEEDIAAPAKKADTSKGPQGIVEKWMDGLENKEAVLKNGKIKFEELGEKEMAKRMLNKRLVFKDRNGNRADGAAVLLKLRDSFQLHNEAQPGFQVEYTNSSSDGDALLLNGAVIADIYHPWLYNDNDLFPSRNWIENPYKVVMRTGVEFDRSDNGTIKDLTSYYLLANFQANPDQQWRVGPQFIQAGVAFDDDGITNKTDTRFILSWQPVMYLDQPLFGSTFGESLGINVRQYHSGFLDLKTVQEAVTDQIDGKSNGKELKGHWYTWMPMDVNLSDSSEILESLTADNDFGGAALSIHTGYGIGNDLHGLRFRYELNADFPLSNMDESRISHALIGEIALSIKGEPLIGKPDDDEVEDFYGSATSVSDTFSGMTIFAKWQTGEFDDSPGSHSEFTVGTRWRF